MPSYVRRFRFVLIALAVAALVGMLFTLQGSAHADGDIHVGRVARSPEISIETLLNPDGTLRTTGASGVVNTGGWNVTLDPKRGPVLSRESAAPMSDASWSALPRNGLKGNGAYVRAMVVYNGALYVGGSFLLSFDNGLALNNIAKFDGTNWSALAENGLTDEVTSLAVFNGTLYVGGWFTRTGDDVTKNLNHIAKYNGTSWSALSKNGLNGAVYAFEVFDSNLYVGGDFSSTQSPVLPTTLYNIARYDGTTWFALPNDGLNSDVYAIKSVGFALYVGGDFTASATGGVTLNKIAYLGDDEWGAMPNNGLSGDVLALATDGTSFVLYVGGEFHLTSDGTIELHKVAKYDGTWSGFPHNGLNGDVNSILVEGTDVYVGGSFSKTFDNSVTLNRIARYNGTAWNALPNDGLNNSVKAMQVWGTGIFVGGQFSQTADANVTGLNAIAKLKFASTQTGPTYVVNSNADTDDGLCDPVGQGYGNQDCTLREAIEEANDRSGANTIHFAADYVIALTASLPTITDHVTIDGETHKVVLDGGNAHRILRVASGKTLDLNRLTLREGFAQYDAPYGASGGAVYVDGGVLNVANSTFQGNTADNYGGAILSDGTTTISNSTFTDNSAGEYGGALIHTGGPEGLLGMNITNSTIRGNSASVGGGLYNQAQLTLTNTIIATSEGWNCETSKPLGMSINNLIRDTGNGACGLANGVNGNKIGVDPKLGALGNNGGVTETFALLAGSPAIDAGHNGTCAAIPISNTDQRGQTRPRDGDGNGSLTCDIGAYEGATVNTPTSTRTPTRTPTRTNTSVVPTNTRTSTRTPTRTPTKTNTPNGPSATPTRTNTSVGASNTPTRTSTATRTATRTATGTSCNAKPPKPTLKKPKDTTTVVTVKVPLKWTAVDCANDYQVIVKNMATGKNAVKQVVTKPKFKITNLPPGTYKWFVKARGDSGASKSLKFTFIKQ